MRIGEKSSSGLDANVAAALSYALGFVTGIVFLFTEQDNKFVRFHALQSTIVFGALSLVSLIVQSIPLLGVLLVAAIVFPVSAGLWLVLMYKAWQGEKFKVWIAGDLAEQRA
jgi:uncharacterized membrane protein